MPGHYRSPSVLFIAHAFPPASGSGPNRMLAFARYLPMYGWRPRVLTVQHSWAAQADPALLDQVPGWLSVVRTPSLEPVQQPPGDQRRGEGGTAVWHRAPPPPARRPSSVRTQRHKQPNFSPATPSRLKQHLGHLKRFPDAHIGWLPCALAAARTMPADVVYSSSGPFTNHVVGLALKRLTGRPWVVELRDGWYEWNRAIFPDYPGWRGPLERRLEAAVLARADRVVFVTDRMCQAFVNQYPGLASRFNVVSNGFDPSHFAQPGTPAPAVDGTFEVVHAGALYYGRGLRPFLDAALRLARELPPFGDRFQLTLVGTADVGAAAELTAHPLANQVRTLGQVSHAVALDAMAAASTLLLVANTTPGARAAVPGKLFEYLAAGRPILALAEADSSTADVLAQTGGGYLASPRDTEAVVGALRAAFEAYQSGAMVQPDPARVARFDRRVLAGDLAGVLSAALG